MTRTETAILDAIACLNEADIESPDTRRLVAEACRLLRMALEVESEL